jgi:hypothetical protein
MTTRANNDGAVRLSDFMIGPPMASNGVFQEEREGTSRPAPMVRSSFSPLRLRRIIAAAAG